MIVTWLNEGVVRSKGERPGAFERCEITLLREYIMFVAEAFPSNITKKHSISSSTVFFKHILSRDRA